MSARWRRGHESRASALHAVGTLALGGGLLLWAIGAALSWWVLRDWLSATLAALLIPAWIASEWSVRGGHFRGTEKILLQFLTLAGGEQLWVLATVPSKGPPRPIALGITRVGEISVRPLSPD